MNNVRLLNPNFNVDLEQTDCCTCGVVFALPNTLLAHKRNNGGQFYCPNGHSLVYAETEVQKLRKRLDQALTRENEQRQRAEAERESAQREMRRADKLAKEAARQKKRASAGVCSCCNRTFANLARHMATKHKDPT